MWRGLLRVKAVMLLLAVAGFFGGCQAAHYPGPKLSGSFGSRGDNEATTGVYIGPNNTYPLIAASFGFFGFAAACVVGAAWIRVTELRTRSTRRRSAGVRSESPDYELIEE